MSCVQLTETVSSLQTNKLSHVHSFALTLHNYTNTKFPPSSMAASNRVDSNDKPQSNALPSIESLFGLKREDDLDLLLPPGDPNRRASVTDRRKQSALPLHPPAIPSHGSISLSDLNYSLPGSSRGIEDNGLEEPRSTAREIILPSQNPMRSPDTPAFDAASDETVIRHRISTHAVTSPLPSLTPSPLTPRISSTTPTVPYSPSVGNFSSRSVAYPHAPPGGSSRGRSYSDTAESDRVDGSIGGGLSPSPHHTRHSGHHRYQLAPLSTTPYAAPSRRSRYGSLNSQEPGDAPPPPPAFNRHLAHLSPDSSKRRHTISDGRTGKVGIQEDRIYKAPPRLPPLSSTSQAHLERQLQSQSSYIGGPIPSPSSITGPSSSSSSELSFRTPLSATSPHYPASAGTSLVPLSPTSATPSRQRSQHSEPYSAALSARPPSPSSFQSLPPSSFPKRLSTTGPYSASTSSASASTTLQHAHAQARPTSATSGSPFAFNSGNPTGPSSHRLTRRTSASSSSDYGQNATTGTYSGRPSSGVSFEGSLSGYEDEGYGIHSGHSFSHDSHSEDIGNNPTPVSSRPTTAGSAKYECEYCQKRFNRPSSLKIHVNTHTGEKPFKCPFPGCGRRFSVSSNMRRHSRVHTQPKSNLSSSNNPFASAPPTFSLNQANEGMEVDDDDDEEEREEEGPSSPRDRHKDVDRTRLPLNSPPPTSVGDTARDVVRDRSAASRSPTSDRAFTRDAPHGVPKNKRRSPHGDDSEVDEPSSAMTSSKKTRSPRKRSKSKVETFPGR
ncbi:hypothetical protein FRC02_000455 [Tulasnella sp. 418]|nr:hypothetical protein FRC02_000455 [Tulasnella sp. 418]